MADIHTQDDTTATGVGMGLIVGIIVAVLIILILGYMFWYRPTYVIEDTNPDVLIEEAQPPDTGDVNVDAPPATGDVNVDIDQQQSDDTSP